MSRTERVPGVRELDHTADVGIEVRAGSREELFHRAGRGLLSLVREVGETDSGAEPDAERRISLEAADAAELLVRWLRELLHLYESESEEYVAAEFEALEDGHLVARVRTCPVQGVAVREVKGVTYHDLDVREAGGEWRARVIFDV